MPPEDLKKLEIKAQDIVADNPYFQLKIAKTPDYQIDYLIRTQFETLFALEIKFSQAELKPDIIKKMKDKLKRFIFNIEEFLLSFSAWLVVKVYFNLYSLIVIIL